MVLELQRLDVRFVSFAPRYPGRFEKGVDYIGSVDEFAKEFAQHAELTQALGPYKLSLHSGSDKFSIYKAAQEATNGLVHLKTAGTSYLEALAVAAQQDPELFRAIYTESLAAYRQARASYHVSASYEAAKQPDQVAATDLPSLLEQHDSRQILHVGFGEILAARRVEDGSRTGTVLGEQLRTLLLEEAELYAQRLEQHFGRHLAPFAATGGGR
jgi:tagaturonate epimerase